MTNKVIIIAGFPGIGKTTASNTFSNVRDLDSGSFDKSDFPENYIVAIHEAKIELGKMPGPSFLLISTHKEVLDILVEMEQTFCLVYPSMALKKRVIQDLKDRALIQKGDWEDRTSSEILFHQFIDDNFEIFLEDISNVKISNKYHFMIEHSWMYMTDIIHIMEDSICKN